MKKIIRALIILLVGVTASAAVPDTYVKEYLGLPASMPFDGSTYTLSWSSHPSPNFYKQEYTVKGDNIENYKKMILVDVLTGNQSIRNIVDMKVAELKGMKASNPHVDYTTTEESGETVLDFIITANAADGKTISIAERNIYRYKKFVTAAGKTGIILFGTSTRAYGTACGDFIKAIKANRRNLTDKFVRVKIPDLTINQ